ncbi:adventurous-gliding motility protein Z-like [Branchiostoma lanceolatum]|uniref:adventurous-gliding motility protein Z-like n=1 Tax=Branchiostoma lanceolatum TaxID=7740 RepID=UPI003456A70D
MLLSACFLVVLAVCTGPEVASYKAVLVKKDLAVLGGGFKRTDHIIKYLESQARTMDRAWGTLKTIDGLVSEHGETIKSMRGGMGLMEPQLSMLAGTLGNLNRSVSQERENLDHVEEYMDDELRTSEERIQSHATAFEESTAQIDQEIEANKQTYTESLSQEAYRQGQVRQAFRQELQDYERARERKRTEIQGLKQTVNSQVAAVRAKDQALDNRVAALQSRVQSMTEDVADLAVQLSEQRLQLEAHEATLTGEEGQLTNVRNSFETHVQQFGQIQQLLATVQGTVMELQTRKGQIQIQASNINTQLQDQQSRFNDNEQQRQSLGQQIADLSDNHEQQSNAKSLGLDDVEATLDTLAADTGIADSVTEMEATVQSLHASIMTGLTAKVEQNQHLQESIQQQQVSQQQSIQTEDAALQAFSQTLDTFDEQIESFGDAYQEQVSTEDVRMQSMETQMSSAESSRSDIVSALQDIVAGLSANVEGAEQQFDQYPSPSAISENVANVEQSIQDVEDTQTALTALQQQFADSTTAFDARFDEMETARDGKEVSLQQTLPDLLAVTQSVNGASAVSDNVASLSTRVAANTEGISALSSSVQRVDTNYRVPLQTQQTTLQQRTDAISELQDQTQESVTGGGIQVLTNQLSAMGTSVDNLKATALAIGTSSESTLETVQADFDTVTTQLSNHENAMEVVESSQTGTSGLTDSVNTLGQNVAGVRSTTTTLTRSIYDIEQELRQPSSSVTDYETGSLVLNERWSTSWFSRSINPYRGEQSRNIRFSRSFQTTPVIYATITKWDINKDNVNRLKVETSSETRSGFKLKFGPWSDTQLYSGKVEWIAIGRKA